MRRAILWSLVQALIVAAPAAAQNGSNFLVLSNGFDVVYAGLGAGGSQVAGVDGFGVWLHGEHARGNTINSLGDFGYREYARRESLCVLGAQIPGLRLDFPALVVAEHDGVNPWTDGAVFIQPFCPTAGCFPLGNSAGFVPYGQPPGSSASFLLQGLPSVVGLPSGTTVLLPNVGLLPSSTGGTVDLLAAASSSLPIASTGFCWVVQFAWAPSALPGRDDINGWWRWNTNGRDGNQYWGLSNDELNAWQSQTVFTDGGLSALQAFFSNLDYETHSLSVAPVTNMALAPVGANGTGVYYQTGAGVPNSGNSVNGGFDMGRHLALSADGVSGAVNPNTGLSNQDPAGSPTAGLVPTLGWVTWNNGPLTTLIKRRWVLIQLDLDQTLAIDPALATDVLFAFGQVRAPLQIPASQPAPWPQSVTLSFLPLWIHDQDDQTGVSGWLDPSGFAGGTFGVLPCLGSSVHLPLGPPPSAAIGAPVGLQVGSAAVDDSGSGPSILKAVTGTGMPSLGSRVGFIGG